jgi:hypothetical protein
LKRDIIGSILILIRNLEGEMSARSRLRAYGIALREIEERETKKRASVEKLIGESEVMPRGLVCFNGDIWENSGDQGPIMLLKAWEVSAMIWETRRQISGSEQAEQVVIIDEMQPSAERIFVAQEIENDGVRGFRLWVPRPEFKMPHYRIIEEATAVIITNLVRQLEDESLSEGTRVLNQATVDRLSFSFDVFEDGSFNLPTHKDEYQYY